MIYTNHLNVIVMYRLFFAYFLLVGSNLWAEGQLNFSVDAGAAIVMNADNGRILYEKNAYEARYPASTTKIATAVYALEKNREFLDSEVVADQESIGALSQEEIKRSNYKHPPYRLKFGGSHMGIKRGESIPLHVLIHGLMLASANDAANVIAQYTSGNINKFMDELNLHLTEMGCRNTHFKNPHGLYHPDHRSCAYDLAIMAKKGLQDPQFREIVKKLRYKRPKTNKQEATTLVQTNRLLKQGPYYYDKAIGIKTGFGDEQGSNIVAAAEHNGRTLIVVLLNCKSHEVMYPAAIEMFREAFAEKQLQKTVMRVGPMQVKANIDGRRTSIVATLEEDVKIRFYPSEEPRIKAWFQTDQRNSPLKKGDHVGQMVFKDENDYVLAVAPLIAKGDNSGSWKVAVRDLLLNQKFLLLSGVILVCFLIAKRGRGR